MSALTTHGEWLRAPGEQDPSRPRLLLISRLYPPSAEVGAARWEAFTAPLVAAGFGIDVIMSHPAQLERVDRARLEALPREVRVFGAAAGDGAVTRGLLQVSSLVQHRRLRSGAAAGEAPVEVVIGDQTPRDLTLRDTMRASITTARQRAWIDAATASAVAIVGSGHVAVLCSGPPHEAYVAGWRIAERAMLPLVLDFRDPWRVSVDEATPLAWLARDPLRRSIESDVMRTAAAVLVNTASAGRVLSGRFPLLAERIHVLPNGSDLPIEPPTLAPNDSPFRIVHTGTLYLGRDPRPFLTAVADVRDRLALGADEFELIFMGPDAIIEGKTLRAWAADAGLEAHFIQKPFGTRDEARALLRTATMTVAFQGPTPTQVPAKIFEYSSFNAWMLALCGRESATAEALDGSAAIVHDLHDVSAISDDIARCVIAFREGTRPEAINGDGRFSRERQSERLVVLLSSLLRRKNGVT